MGKTTVMREIARVLADELHKRVVSFLIPLYDFLILLSFEVPFRACLVMLDSIVLFGALRKSTNSFLFKFLQQLHAVVNRTLLAASNIALRSSF